ncbi:hypothetical protein KC344_g37 [Hortaea werneckii]|nr:hypothetical protein KC344_g37 [Hortaea werneckii]
MKKKVLIHCHKSLSSLYREAALLLEWVFLQAFDDPSLQFIRPPHLPPLIPRYLCRSNGYQFSNHLALPAVPLEAVGSSASSHVVAAFGVPGAALVTDPGRHLVILPVDDDVAKRMLNGRHVLQRGTRLYTINLHEQILGQLGTGNLLDGGAGLLAAVADVVAGLRRESIPLGLQGRGCGNNQAQYT